MIENVPNSTWNTIFRILFYGLFGFVFLWVGLFLWDNRESLDAFKRAPMYFWLLPVVLYLITIYVKGLSFDIVAQVFGKRISFTDTIGLTSSSLLSNYALPGNSGIAFRVIYMQRVLDLSYKRYLPILVIAFLFSTALYGLAAGLASALQGGFETELAQYVLVLISGGSVLVIGFLLAIVPLSEFRFFKIGKFHILLEGWLKFIRSKRLLSFWFLIEFLRSALETAIFHIIAVWIFEMELSVLQSAVVVLIKECSMFFRITPGALGVAEGVQVFFAHAYNVSVVDMLLVSVTYRLVEIACLAVTSALFVPALKEKLFDNDTPNTTVAE